MELEIINKLFAGISALEASLQEVKYERDNLMSELGILSRENDSLRAKSAAFDKVMEQESVWYAHSRLR